MNIEIVKNKLPDYAKDIKLNFTSIVNPEGAPELTQQQIYSIILACTYVAKNAELLDIMQTEAVLLLAESEIQAAKSAATIMAMNNVYYRFVHLVEDKSFATMPAKLRMNVIANPGVSKIDFELMCLAVSAINGCGMCIEAHVNELIKAGLSKLAIQSAVRIAAVVNAVAVGLDIAK